MDELLASVYSEPEKWDSCRLHFKRGTFSIWVANGFWFVAPDEAGNETFGLIDKWRWWRAYKWWCKNAPVEALADES